MLFNRILRYVMGNVKFLIDGSYPEKFLNLAARDGIMLWDIRPSDSGLQAGTLARNFKKLRKPAEQSGVKLSVVRCGGLPFQTKKYRKRTGIVAGVILFIAVIWFFSSFIWTVNVTGNSKTNADEIAATLSELGLRPGAFPAMLNTHSIEQEALIKLPDLSWISININGSNADVKVRERKYPPDIVPQTMPCNVKALETGQIIKLEVYQGKAMVRVGDTVSKGGLIISGVVTDKNGASMLMHAGGKAVARTKLELTVHVPYQQTVKQDTGKSVSRNTLGIFGLDIPLYFSKPTGDYRITINRKALSILGLNLPFSITTRSYISVKDASVIYTKAQAGELAERKLLDEEKTELAGIKIISRNTQPAADEHEYTLTGQYTCEENIAYQEEITLS